MARASLEVARPGRAIRNHAEFVERVGGSRRAPSTRMSVVDSDELFERMFAVQHRVLVDMANVAAFEEWAALEVLAMRVFCKTPHALGATDLAEAIGCSLPHASRLAKKLKARGFVSEHRWHQYRSLSRTLDGEEWARRELPNLTAFTAGVFADLSLDERRQLYELLGRIRRSAS